MTDEQYLILSAQFGPGIAADVWLRCRGKVLHRPMHYYRKTARMIRYEQFRAEARRHEVVLSEHEPKHDGGIAQTEAIITLQRIDALKPGIVQARAEERTHREQVWRRWLHDHKKEVEAMR